MKHGSDHYFINNKPGATHPAGPVERLLLDLGMGGKLQKEEKTMSNIEKIRQEIERRIGSVNEKQDANPAMPKYRWLMYEGMKVAFIDMKYFIDSLQEEKPSEDLEKVAAKYERENRQSILSSVDIVDAFVAGAKWQKEQDATQRK